MNEKLNPMTIYIQWPGHTPEDFINETNQLGQFTYPKKDLGKGLFSRRHIFTKLAGFVILEELIKKDRMDILQITKIISSSGREYSLEKFLNSLENIEIR